MNTRQRNTAKEEAQTLIRRSGWVLTEQEWQALSVNDFGLGNVLMEGFAFVDLLRSPRLRTTLLVLLPKQTLPQHMHPPHEDEEGKEETIRVLHGQAKVYVPGPENNPHILIPSGKEAYYTARHEIPLDAGQQFTITPTTEHWFQGGRAGAVCLCVQNRVDETKNIFADPRSLGCPIKLTD